MLALEKRDHARWLGLLISVCLTCTVIGQTRPRETARKPAAQTEVAKAPGQPPPAGWPDPLIIPEPQIADEAMQLDQRLRGLPERLVSESSLSETERQVQQLRETIGEKTRETEELIESGALMADLQQPLLEWQFLRSQITDTAAALKEWATSLEAEALPLRDSQSRWTRTLDQMKAEKPPRPPRSMSKKPVEPELLPVVQKAMAAISAAVDLAEKQRTRVITLQQSVAMQGSIVSGEIEDVRKAMARLQRGLLEADSPRLWEAQFAHQTEEDLLARSLRKSYANDIIRLGYFLREKRAALSFIAILMVVAFVLFVRLGRRSNSQSLDSPGTADPVNVFAHPASLALLVGVVASLPLLPGAPASAVGLAYLLATVPVVRLLMPRLMPGIRVLPVALIVSVLTFQLIRFLQVPVWIKRDLLAVFCLAVAVTFWRLERAVRRGRAQLQRVPVATRAVIHMGLVLIVAALLANIFGYFRLSDLLTNGTLASAYRAVALYTVYVVVSSMVLYALRWERARFPAAVAAGGGRLAGQLSFALGVVLFLVWLRSALNVFTVREGVYETLKAALEYQITIGSATFSLSHVLAFVLTLLFGYLVATLIGTFLSEEILPRFRLARGLPNAIATITHYVALVLIFMLALVAAGIELSKFTLFTGALGVGVGFGLQNVVNNFVSGLILLFERPVRVGDLLDVGGIGGEVAKIGFRSSTLKCFDGSALIIPNADLISQRVINWTLTGTRRQIVLNVQVAHGNDPARVRDLLRETVSAHPDVLDSPEPMAFFLGFGESALNFEVRFWAPRPQIVLPLKSDVGLNIAAALSEAGIKVPIPQRDLYIRSDDQARNERTVSRRKQTIKKNKVSGQIDEGVLHSGRKRI